VLVRRGDLPGPQAGRELGGLGARLVAARRVVVVLELVGVLAVGQDDVGDYAAVEARGHVGGIGVSLVGNCLEHPALGRDRDERMPLR